MSRISEVLVITGIGSSRAAAVQDAWEQARRYFRGCTGIRSQAMSARAEERMNTGEVLAWAVEAEFYLDDGKHPQPRTTLELKLNPTDPD